ncbi:MAG TPA: OB-fold domain-containing protein, partial [Chloroflexota bacterium]
AWEPLVPYVVGVIELAEGPRVITNIVEIPPEKVEIGMAVEVFFQPISDTVKLPLFRPLGLGPGVAR